MAKRRRESPSYCKWWIDDWHNSSFRRRLKTPAIRGIYREFWDFCMSCPKPGSAVDSAGKPFTDSEIADEIGCRLDQFRNMIRTGLQLGRITRGAGNELSLNTKDTEKSLPDHWKYKRLHDERSDTRQMKDVITSRLDRDKDRDRDIKDPPTPLESDEIASKKLGQTPGPAENPDTSANARREAQAKALAKLYRDTVVGPGEDDSYNRGWKNAGKLLRNGQPFADLQAAVLNYSEAMAIKATSAKYRIHVSNFFGRAAVFEAYVPNAYVRPTPSSSAEPAERVADVKAQLKRVGATSHDKA